MEEDSRISYMFPLDTVLFLGNVYIDVLLNHLWHSVFYLAFAILLSIPWETPGHSGDQAGKLGVKVNENIKRLPLQDCIHENTLLTVVF